MIWKLPDPIDCAASMTPRGEKQIDDKRVVSYRRTDESPRERLCHDKQYHERNRTQDIDNEPDNCVHGLVREYPVLVGAVEQNPERRADEIGEES